MNEDFENGYQQGYEAGNANRCVDLSNVEYNNPIVDACWLFTVIKFGVCALGSLGFIIYFAYLAIHG